MLQLLTRVQPQQIRMESWMLLLRPKYNRGESNRCVCMGQVARQEMLSQKTIRSSSNGMGPSISAKSFPAKMCLCVSLSLCCLLKCVA